MIRILQVVTYMGRGGLETMLMNYYRNIDRSKIQFDFLVHRDFRADYDDEIESMGGIIYHLPRLNPFSVTYRKELKNFFVEHPEYRVIHVHQDCMSSVILKVAKECGVKVRIAHSHNANQDKNLKYVIKLFYRFFIPMYATNLFACSQDAGEWMYRKHEFQILNNAIDAQEYRFNFVTREKVRKRFDIKKDVLLVGHVGRFSYQKNHIFLLDIFNDLQKNRNAKLMLIGGKSLKPEDATLMDDIKKKVHMLGLDEKVIFAGVCDNVPEMMQAMDVFILPSHYEGLGIVTVEAQAAGLPCVISDVLPDECIVTDNVKKIPLTADASVWANAVCELSNYKRGDTFEKIKEKGFDIVENAVKLQRYYLDIAGEKA